MTTTPPAGTITVRGRTFEVHVTISYTSATFATDYDGTRVWANDMATLYDRLMTKTRVAGVRLSKRVARVTPDSKLERGTITTIHGGTGNLMVHWNDNQKHTQESHTYGWLDLDKLDEEQVVTLAKVLAQRTALQGTIDALSKNAGFDEPAFRHSIERGEAVG